jgi:branched-subunit amino acid transport protein
MSTIWLAMIGLGILTFLTRLSFIALLERWQAPLIVQRALRFVPIAVLTAIIIPELVLQNGTINLYPENARLLAGLVAIVVAWKTKNVIVTIVAGMLVFWFVQLFFQLAP